MLHLHTGIVCSTMYTKPVTDMEDRGWTGCGSSHMLSGAAWCIVARPSDLVMWCNYRYVGLVGVQ